MYRYLDEARHTTGQVAEGHTFAVYNDASLLNLATLYAAEAGGAYGNPVIVPVTGIIDFWAVERTLFYNAGDAVARPLRRFDYPDIIVSATAPTAPEVGDMWLDTTSA